MPVRRASMPARLSATMMEGPNQREARHCLPFGSRHRRRPFGRRYRFHPT